MARVTISRTIEEVSLEDWDYTWELAIDVDIDFDL